MFRRPAERWLFVPRGLLVSLLVCRIRANKSQPETLGSFHFRDGGTDRLSLHAGFPEPKRCGTITNDVEHDGQDFEQDQPNVLAWLKDGNLSGIHSDNTTNACRQQSISTLDSKREDRGCYFQQMIYLEITEVILEQVRSITPLKTGITHHMVLL